MQKIKPMKFVPECYAYSDKTGKNILRNFLISKGHTIISDKEDGQHDMITEKEGKTYYFEVELKNKYLFTTRDSFPFSTVSFLGRKKRLHDLQPYIYVIICEKTGWALSIDSHKIFKEEYLEEVNINTKMRKGLDIMFRVPKSECKFFCINE